MDGFEMMTAGQAWDEHGWGVSLRPGSTVYRKAVGDTVIWVGLPHELGPERWVCEVEVGAVLEGQRDGSDPYDAMLNGVLDSVVRQAVREEWDEPKEQGLKYCCEDVVNAMAYYGFQAIKYGWEMVGEMFPHSPEGTPQTEDDHELLDDLMGHAIGFMREHGERHGVEFEDVWN